VNIESEDEDMDVDEDEDDEEEEESPKKAGRLTARQAVLASVADPSHIALDESGSAPGLPGAKSRKKQLSEMELALKREETARKRRNLTEKKLEDEKVHLTWMIGAFSHIF